jgi:exosome complex component MTR3
LETALRGVIIADRWPKSGVEVIITILEGEEDQWWGDDRGRGAIAAGEWGMMSVLSGCITVASAAIADAGIDCVDVVSGGVAAVVRSDTEQGSTTLVLDPVPSEHQEILAASVVAYLPSRDEITDLWVKGDIGHDRHTSEGASYEDLADNAVQAALGSHRVLVAALKETAEMKIRI